MFLNLSPLSSLSFTMRSASSSLSCILRRSICSSEWFFYSSSSFWSKSSSSSWESNFISKSSYIKPTFLFSFKSSSFYNSSWTMRPLLPFAFSRSRSDVSIKRSKSLISFFWLLLSASSLPHLVLSRTPYLLASLRSCSISAFSYSSAASYSCSVAANQD